jgi:hypothetical protein
MAKMANPFVHLALFIVLPLLVLGQSPPAWLVPVNSTTLTLPDQLNPGSVVTPLSLTVLGLNPDPQYSLQSCSPGCTGLFSISPSTGRHLVTAGSLVGLTSTPYTLLLTAAVGSSGTLYTTVTVLVRPSYYPVPCPSPRVGWAPSEPNPSTHQCAARLPYGPPYLALP